MKIMSLQFLNVLFDVGDEYNLMDPLLISSCAAGSLECLKYAYENGCSWDKETYSSAARRGSLECLKYAHENGCPWDENTCSCAAENGHLECLKYAQENGCQPN